MPGLATNAINPQFTARTYFGVAPYTYNWEPIPGNTTTLDHYDIINPSIIASTGTNLAYYRLTIYDGSQPQKVANRDIRVQLTTAGSYYLGMRDSYVVMLDQPNSQGTVDTREWANIFSSPDIWNRQNNDGSTVPQDAIYRALGLGNYMYVRVRNVGCADYTPIDNANIHAYWTLASTGEHWAEDWDGSTMVAGSGGGVVAGGQEITGVTPVTPVPVPLLHPGDQFITGIPWYATDPFTYLGSPTNIDVCVLARLEEPTKPLLGMYVAENPNISEDERNNKNIVTRNMSDVYLGLPSPPPFPPVTHRVYSGNTGDPQKISLQMLTERDVYKHFAGNISEYM